MRVVKIKAEWVESLDGTKTKSELKFVAIEDDDGFIDHTKDISGVITGYDYGKRREGDYPFYYGGESNQKQHKYLHIKWGRDYQDVDSTLDILGRKLAIDEIITHHEIVGDNKPYHYKITKYDSYI